MSTSARYDAYRAVRAHLHELPPVSAGVPDMPSWAPAGEDARLYSAVKVALDAAGVPPLVDGWPEVPS